MKLGEDLFVGEPLYRVRPSSLEHDYLQYNLTKSVTLYKGSPTVEGTRTVRVKSLLIYFCVMIKWKIMRKIKSWVSRVVSKKKFLPMLLGEYSFQFQILANFCCL